MTIRRLTLQDANVLAEIAADTFRHTFEDTCSKADMDFYLKKYYSLEQMQYELADPDSYYFFIEDEKAVPLGFLRLKEERDGYPAMNQYHSLELNRIYVRHQYQGQGIAQRLMDFALQFANDGHYEVIWLGVWEHNYRAQKFYKKYGFEPTGDTHDFPIGETPQTDLWYWKRLR
ncbi:MAG: hypothetical protein RLY16_695 [Bacteroidota bacterium]|jgi:ribosomal protein S18 acetylase RimI-like enzyme